MKHEPITVGKLISSPWLLWLALILFSFFMNALFAGMRPDNCQYITAAFVRLSPLVKALTPSAYYSVLASSYACSFVFITMFNMLWNVCTPVTIIYFVARSDVDYLRNDGISFILILLIVSTFTLFYTPPYAYQDFLKAGASTTSWGIETAAMSITASISHGVLLANLYVCVRSRLGISRR